MAFERSHRPWALLILLRCIQIVRCSDGTCALSHAGPNKRIQKVLRAEGAIRKSFRPAVPLQRGYSVPEMIQLSGAGVTEPLARLPSNKLEGSKDFFNASY